MSETTATATVKYASMDPEDMAEGSGLFDDVDAAITNIQFTKEPPDNYNAEGNPIFSNVSFLLKGDGPEEERRAGQSYSLGASAGDHFTISEDGYKLVPTGDVMAPRKDSKWGTFLATLKNEGVPKPIMQSGDMSKFVGLQGHFKRIADKARTFGEERQSGRKSKFPPSTLVCTKIHVMPGETAVGKSNGGVKQVTTAQAATETTAPNVGSQDLDTETWTYLEKVLKAAKTHKEQRGRLTLAVAKAAGADPNRAAVARRVSEESFINEMVALGLINYGASETGQPVSLAG